MKLDEKESRPPSQPELMGMHVHALYTHDDRLRIESINQWDGGAAPRLFLGRTAAGNLWRFRADLPEDLIKTLARLCRDEPKINADWEAPVHGAEYCRLLANHAPISRIWSGPAYWLPTGAASTLLPVAIDETNADLLREGLDEWRPDVPHRQPFFATVIDGRAVSICASVRITGAAHEAGVETMPAYRRRGHAAHAVAGWAAAVRERGATPLYSTSWENAASQAVVASLGGVIYGVDYHIT